MAETKTKFNLSPEAKAKVVEVLCEQGLSDHLGDVRDAERHLWALLDLDTPDGDSDSAYRNTRDHLKKNGLPLPDHLGGFNYGEDEDDDEDALS